MAITNYTELKTAIANWLSRADQTTRIPEYIALAEAKFWHGDNAIRVQAMQSRTTGTSSSGVIALPTGYLETIRLSVDSGGNDYALEYANPVFFTSYETQSGIPGYFTLLNNGIQIGPNSNTDYTHDYYKKLDALSDSVATNWIITNAPNVYLYGALAEAYLVIKDDQKAAQFNALYQDAVRGINKSEKRKFESHGMAVMLA